MIKFTTVSNRTNMKYDFKAAIVKSWLLLEHWKNNIIHSSLSVKANEFVVLEQNNTKEHYRLLLFHESDLTLSEINC